MTRSRTERAAAVAGAPGLRALLRRVPAWRGVLVLNYHRIGSAAGQPWDAGLFSADADAFDAQLALLTREADVIAPSDLEALAADGRGRHVLVTFDDGYRDNYELAYPLLRRHGVRAAFFIATGFLDAPRPAWWDEIAWMVRQTTRDMPAAEAAIADAVACYKALPASQTAAFLDTLAQDTGSGRCPDEAADGLWMSWDMARELRDGGMWIGGHTVDHPVLSSLDAEGQEAEIAGCARRLREELALAMDWFSYPVGSAGSFTDTTRTILRRHGVRVAFSFYGGVARFAAWDPLDVRRVHVGPRMSRAVLGASLRLPQLFARPQRG